MDGLLGSVFGYGDWLKRRARSLLDPQTYRNAMNFENYQPLTQDQLVDGLLGAGVLGTVKNAAKFVAPRDEAFAIAQRNAAKPVSEGGLGLAPNNTAAERARAMGYKPRDYSGTHKAPTSADTGYSAPLHQLNKTYPDDIYSSMGARYYGDGADPVRDAALIRRMQLLRNKPDALVPVYRAVPKDAGQYINHGDWVTMDRQYAKDHGEAALNGDYKIIYTRTPAKTLFTEGNSIYEFGIDKSQRFADGPASMPTMVSKNAPFERSLFAAFDPALIDENDLLGRARVDFLGLLGLGSLGAAGYMNWNNR